MGLFNYTVYFILFLPIFLFLFLLGFIKAAILSPFVFLVIAVGDAGVLIGLWPFYLLRSICCIMRTKKFGPYMKSLLILLTPIPIALWTIVGLVGSAVMCIVFGCIWPVMETFRAISEEGLPIHMKLIKCFTDGTWSNVWGACNVLCDFAVFSFHSYFSVMDGLLESEELDPIELKVSQIPGCILTAIFGILVDVPLISLIVLYKAPILLFKGWHRLIQDLIRREGPFVETVSIPYAVLWIIFWPILVLLATLGGISSSFLFGFYAAAIAYEENSMKKGLLCAMSIQTIYQICTKVPVVLVLKRWISTCDPSKSFSRFKALRIILRRKFENTDGVRIPNHEKRMKFDQNLLVDKGCTKNQKVDDFYEDNEELSFVSPKKLKSLNDVNIERVTHHQNRDRSCTTPLKMKICLFEDFKLEKSTFGARDIEVLEYIFCESVKQDQLIVECNGHYLLRHDFQYLSPKEEIELEIITMVSVILTEDERSRTSGKARKWYLPARITKDQLPYCDLPLHKAWDKMNYYKMYMSCIDECEEIFVPILISRHYILARVLLKMHRVEVWDSLSEMGDPILYASRIRDILHNLDLGLEGEIKKMPPTFSFLSFSIVRAESVPRQPNGFDCGIFVILFMQSGCKADSRSVVFDSNEKRCRLACWLACSNYNRNKERLLNDVRDFHLKRSM